MAWTPTIAKWLRPLSPSAERFRKREREILDNPKANLPDAVRAVTEIAYESCSSAILPNSLIWPRSDSRRQTSSSTSSSRPAAFSKKAPIHRAAWPRFSCTRRSSWMSRRGCRRWRRSSRDAQRREDLQDGEELRQRRSRQGRGFVIVEGNPLEIFGRLRM